MSHLRDHLDRGRFFSNLNHTEKITETRFWINFCFIIDNMYHSSFHDMFNDNKIQSWIPIVGNRDRKYIYILLHSSYCYFFIIIVSQCCDGNFFIHGWVVFCGKTQQACGYKVDEALDYLGHGREKRVRVASCHCLLLS